MQNSPLFIDTNIILDLLDDKRNSFADSKRLIETALYNDIKLAISDDIVTTVYYLAQKSVKREKLLAFIAFLNKNFTILPFDSEIIDMAIEIALKNSNYDFEDVLQICCAIKNGYKIVVTNDKKFPKLDGVEVLKPVDIL